MLTIIFYISLIFFADFLNNCQAEIIDCRKQDRDDYYRIVFDLNKKPSYFVYQFGEKIYVRIQNEMEAKIKAAYKFSSEFNDYISINKFVYYNITGGIAIWEQRRLYAQMARK